MQSSQYVFPLPPIRRLATRSVTFIPVSLTSVLSQPTLRMTPSWCDNFRSHSLHYSRVGFIARAKFDARAADPLRPPLRRFAVCQFAGVSKSPPHRAAGTLSGRSSRGPENFHNWAEAVSWGDYVATHLCFVLGAAGSAQRVRRSADRRRSSGCGYWRAMPPGRNVRCRPGWPARRLSLSL